MPNPLSGHTAAQLTGAADGLRDGDVITSPSVTNALEAIHGNGILRLHDSTYGSTRNIVNGGEGALSDSGIHRYCSYFPRRARCPTVSLCHIPRGRRR